MKSNLRLIILVLFIVTLGSCNSKKEAYTNLNGDVFATYYRFQIDSDKDFSKQIDSVFKAIDKAINSYVQTSEISDFNNNGIVMKPSPTFVDLLQKAKHYHQLSNGYFEPTLYPVIKAWRFDAENKVQMDSVKIDSLLKLVSFDKLIVFNSAKVEAVKKGTMLDLNALGEGYAIDAISSILDRSNIKNYMIEIGGEMKCKGRNAKGELWKVGIEDPSISIENRGTSFMKIIEIENQALSTSGSYRKFYTDSLGNKFSHIINPKTGYPAKHNLLSVSLLSNSAITADALATACMAMGTEKSMQFIEEAPNLEGFLIYTSNGKLITWQSSKFPK